MLHDNDQSDCSQRSASPYLVKLSKRWLGVVHCSGGIPSLCAVRALLVHCFERSHLLSVFSLPVAFSDTRSSQDVRRRCCGVGCRQRLSQHLQVIISLDDEMGTKHFITPTATSAAVCTITVIAVWFTVCMIHDTTKVYACCLDSHLGFSRNY